MNKDRLGLLLVCLGALFLVRGYWSRGPRRPTSPKPTAHALLVVVSGPIAPEAKSRLLLVDFPEVPYRLEIPLPPGAASVQSENPVELPVTPHNAVVSVTEPGKPNEGTGEELPCIRKGDRLNVTLRANR